MYRSISTLRGEKMYPFHLEIVKDTLGRLFCKKQKGRNENLFLHSAYIPVTSLDQHATKIRHGCTPVGHNYMHISNVSDKGGTLQSNYKTVAPKIIGINTLTSNSLFCEKQGQTKLQKTFDTWRFLVVFI